MQPGFKIHGARNQAIKPVHSVALTVWLANTAVADSELTKRGSLLSWATEELKKEMQLIM